MKVISGKYKGRVLIGYTMDGTRPTMDRVKESMFAMIQKNIKDSVVVDLFAGSGNLGIEAISNGAKKVYFVDKSKEAIKVIRRNLQQLNVDEEVELLPYDYKRALTYFRERNITFQIVLLDPPYEKHCINQILNDLVAMHLLDTGALVICEYRTEEVKSDKLILQKKRKYGDKFVSIYEYQKK